MKNWNETFEWKIKRLEALEEALDNLDSQLEAEFDSSDSYYESFGTIRTEVKRRLNDTYAAKARADRKK